MVDDDAYERPLSKVITESFDIPTAYGNKIDQIQVLVYAQGKDQEEMYKQLKPFLGDRVMMIPRL